MPNRRRVKRRSSLIGFADNWELLKSDPAKVKAEFRRLNLKLTFNPIEAKPRPYFIVNGQCDLSALAFFYVRSKGAVLDSLLDRTAL